MWQIFGNSKIRDNNLDHRELRENIFVLMFLCLENREETRNWVALYRE